MVVATNEVGVRQLKNELSAFLARVKDGEEVVVTDRRRPVARLIPIDRSSDRLAELRAAGRVRPPVKRLDELPPPLDVGATVSDLIAEQRG
jgi:prevent-host-death family protein